MSRAIGDLQYKNPVNTLGDEEGSTNTRRAAAVAPDQRGNFLSNEPHLTRLALSPQHRYVLVAVSDGVSDHTDDATLIKHVMKLSMRGMRAGDIAREVATSATSRRANGDNASCIVVLLDGQDSRSGVIDWSGEG